MVFLKKTNPTSAIENFYYIECWKHKKQIKKKNIFKATMSLFSLTRVWGGYKDITPDCADTKACAQPSQSSKANTQWLWDQDPTELPVLISDF